MYENNIFPELAECCSLAFQVIKRMNVWKIQRRSFKQHVIQLIERIDTSKTNVALLGIFGGAPLAP